MKAQSNGRPWTFPQTRAFELALHSTRWWFPRAARRSAHLSEVSSLELILSTGRCVFLHPRLRVRPPAFLPRLRNLVPGPFEQVREPEGRESNLPVGKPPLERRVRSRISYLPQELLPPKQVARLNPHQYVF